MNFGYFRLWAIVSGLVVLCPALWAQTIGEVEFARGVAFAQTPGQTPRTLGKGLALREGDRLSTSEGSSAIIKLQDGTRMTLRPNSELVLQQYQFKENDESNNMVMSLVRGGLRAITGLISKGSPNAAKIQTSTATIGIRGTDFDARICSKDCGTESGTVQDNARPTAVQASAKVVSLEGDLYAVDATGQRRRLVVGGSVYPGDVIETGAATKVALAFRDDSRITLGASTRFRVDSFVFDDRNPSEGRFLVSLLRGSVRALTGLIGKANNRNVSYATPTATIGIRGTDVEANCSDTACNIFNWLGSIVVTQNGQPATAFQTLVAGQGLFVGPQGVRPLAVQPAPLPAPGDVKVDVKQLFTTNNVADTDEGLFVFVRDGHIEVATAKEILHLGKGETGFANDAGDTNRPAFVPKFIDFDKVPLPNNPNAMVSTVLTENSKTLLNLCK